MAFVMNERQELILKIIVEEYIETAAPVSSSFLVEKYKLDISSATVRNEMAELELAGYIMQPHTSSGRIPTEQAYLWFVENLAPKKISNALASKLVVPEIWDELSLKALAKNLADISGLAVFCAFHRHNLYYTGISNLLSQPEFTQSKLVYDMSVIIDRLDDIINEAFDEFVEGPKISLGQDCLFGSFTASVTSKYRLKDHVGILGIIGPLRQDYEKNWQLINHLYEQISK
jgi:transcriptional regulator of heat shock response